MPHHNAPMVSADTRNTSQPFFTVIIPTMNRPHLLKVAIATVLKQNFGDFELLISDNSNTAEFVAQNRSNIERYADDSRVRYLQPDHWMNMPDHWEFASRHAKGRFVVILTDRFAMRPSALKLLKAEIEKLPADCRAISWGSNSSLSQFGILHTTPFTGSVKIMASAEMLRDFTALASWRTAPVWENHLPRMLNSCYRQDLAEEVREKYGALFMPITPDYVAAFMLLAHSERVAFIDRPLFFNHGNESNGQRSLVFGLDAYVNSLGDIDWHLDVPAPFYTATCMVLRDFLFVKRLVSPKYADITLDTVGYFLYNFREFQQMEHLGSQRDVQELYAQWWAAVAQLPEAQQSQIRADVKKLETQRPSFIRLRRLAVQLRLVGAILTFSNAVRYIHRKLLGLPVYTNVLDAAKRSDNFLTSDDLLTRKTS